MTGFHERGMLSFVASKFLPPGHHGDGGVQAHGLLEAGAQESELAQVGILQSARLGALRCHQQSRCVQLSFQLVLQADPSRGHLAQVLPEVLCRVRLSLQLGRQAHSASRRCCCWFKNLLEESCRSGSESVRGRRLGLAYNSLCRQAGAEGSTLSLSRMAHLRARGGGITCHQQSCCMSFDF